MSLENCFYLGPVLWPPDVGLYVGLAETPQPGVLGVGRYVLAPSLQLGDNDAPVAHAEQVGETSVPLYGCAPTLVGASRAVVVNQEPAELGQRDHGSGEGRLSFVQAGTHKEHSENWPG